MRKVNLSSFIYPTCVVLLLMSNGFLLWQKSHALPAGSERGVNIAAVQSLMEQPLPDVDGKPVYLAGAPSRYLVLFVFSPGDCTACLEELTELNRVAQGQSNFTVYGLMSYATPDEMRQTQRNFNVSFPLLQDARGQVLDSLKPPKTPWKIVVNVDRNQVVYEDMPSVTAAEREAFISRLGLLAGSSS